MSDDSDEGVLSKNSMPLAGIAVIIAQMTMAAATYQAEWLTDRGCGRKILFLIGLWSMPIRCALLVWLKDAGNFWLLLTQVLDGIGSGYIGLVHPYLVADITFGTGRFNLISKSTFLGDCFFLDVQLSIPNFAPILDTVNTELNF